MAGSRIKGITVEIGGDTTEREPAGQVSGFFPVPNSSGTS